MDGGGRRGGRLRRGGERPAAHDLGGDLVAYEVGDGLVHRAQVVVVVVVEAEGAEEEVVVHPLMGGDLQRRLVAAEVVDDRRIGADAGGAGGVGRNVVLLLRLSSIASTSSRLRSARSSFVPSSSMVSRGEVARLRGDSVNSKSTGGQTSRGRNRNPRVRPCRG